MALLRLQSFFYLKQPPRTLSSSSHPSDNAESNERDRTKSLNQMIKTHAWSSEFDLYINCIGYSVGLGNLWRFPYRAFKNGGGAFLFPYLILTVFISVPLYYMELFIGQNSKLNPVAAWSFCPAFKGVGISMLLCTFFIEVYYNVIMAYSIIYLLASFQKLLPWSECFRWWGADDSCYEVNKKVVLCDSLNGTTANATNCSNATESSPDQFFKVHVLGLSSGLDDPGTVKWQLALALLSTWVIVCLLTIGRYHSKVHVMCKTIYFTALLPFLLLSIYFFYTITLPGAVAGLGNLFIPRWSALLDITVWAEAAQTSMFSVGVGTGGLIIFGGKAGYHYSTAKCTYVSCAVDTFAAVLAATVTFMVVGFLSQLFDLEFSETTLSGHGLVFVTFPSAVLNMDIPHLWSIAFFLMLFCLALDSSIAQTETLSLGIHALFYPPDAPMKPIVALTSLILFLCGLSCVTHGGTFVLNILDHYGGGHSLMGTVWLESVAFGWGYYGIYQASDDIEKMSGSSPNICMKLCWTVLAPVSLIVMFVYSLKDSQLVSLYNIPYPWYTKYIGWSIVTVSLLPVPLLMVIVLFRHRKDVYQVFKPNKEWKNAVQERQKDN